jgi:peptidoglycan L-alanyl-D-glutamate endopeptidase CwlK
MHPLKFTFILCFLSSSFIAQANIQCVKQAYPDHVRAVSNEVLTWQDGTLMPMQDGKTNKTMQERLDYPSLLEQLTSEVYKKGFSPNEKLDPISDSGRIRYEPFFKKMYGETQEQVESHLVIVYWMPHIFGYQYPLPVTTVNGVNFQFESLSRDLETWVQKHPEDVVYLANPGGTYNWRKIANTNRQSMHAFGMTIDLTPQLTEYWQTDLIRAGRPISEDEPLVYHNQLPLEVVSIFEAHGFIWGGKWHHYDTQHFEYRPELLC